VTGSMFLVQTPGGKILVDCGMFQGRRAEARARNQSLPAEVAHADAVVLTHAHIDHSGSLPTLVKHGYEGSIYATHATRDLCAFMLRDSGHIQENDAQYLNEKNRHTRGWVPIAPIYDEEDAVRALGRFVGVGYHHRFQPIAGCTASFFDAGHILGSAQLLLEVTHAERTTRVLFSGDLGRPGLPILQDPEAPVPPLDAVVMESTYGNRVHGEMSRMHEDLLRVVTETVARGGRVLVPSFALGRTQELLRVLGDLRRSGQLPDVPVFVDSPLATDITTVFRAHPECFDRETRRRLDTDGAVFDFPGLSFVTAKEDSIALNRRPGPAIIIAASGMAETGRILHHLRYGVEDPRNTVLVVGFMAEHTLGRRLVERQPQVHIFGVTYDLRARVEVLSAFSAHADRDTLRWYATTAHASKTFLVHGEPDQQEPLRASLAAAGLSVHVPERGETCEIDGSDR
jgi:metallo-beta-lactamase family protein